MAPRRPSPRHALLGAVLWFLEGCAAAPVAPYRGEQPLDRTVFVLTASWHTEIGLSGDDITGPLATLRRSFPRAQYLVFGWGAEGYYMARHPDFADLLRAVAPGPAVMLVIPVQTALSDSFGGDTRIVAVPAAPGGVARLSQFLWSYLSKAPDGSLRAVGSGPYPGSVFYAAQGTYDISHTCNSFTAEGLYSAGLPVDPSGVIRAEQVIDQLQTVGRQIR